MNIPNLSDRIFRFEYKNPKIFYRPSRANLVYKEADNQLVIGCGDKSLSLLKVQKAGGKPMLIQDFLRGNKLHVGGIFE